MEKLYTVQEVADYLRIHFRTVYPMIRSGKLRAVKMGKYWRIPESALREFLERGKRGREWSS